MAENVTGVKETIANLAATMKKIRAGARQGLRVGAEKLMTRSKKLCPVEFGVGGGNLRTTGHVSPVEDDGERMTITVGYGGPSAPYAVKVHENPRSGKTGGVNPDGSKRKQWAKVGQWKYLEQPYNEMQETIKADVAAGAAAALR